MKDGVGRVSISKLKLVIFTIVASLVLFRLVGSITELTRESKRELFVVEVLNNLSHEVDHVQLSGLGKKGELGLVRPQEPKRIVVEQGVLTEDIDFHWTTPSGANPIFGRPDKWRAGTNVEGLVFRVTLNEDGSVSCSDEKLKMLYRIKHCR